MIKKNVHQLTDSENVLKVFTHCRKLLLKAECFPLAKIYKWLMESAQVEAGQVIACRPPISLTL